MKSRLRGIPARLRGGSKAFNILRVALTSAALLITTLEAAPPDYSTIEPIFTAHCLDCHGSTEPEGKLVMESHELLMKGGDSGDAILPGNSAGSLLVRMVEGNFEEKGKKKIMPPGKRDKLKSDEIALIKAWIDAGAKPPAEFNPRKLVVPKIDPRVPPRNAVNALAVSPARKVLAAARYGEVELRSVETHAVTRRLAGHRGSVNAVDFSPDGRFLFAAGGDAGLLGEVRQWDLDDGNLFYVFEGHKDAIYALAVSPDGRTIATGSYDHKIKLWNVATGEESGTLSGHNGCVFDLAFRTDGKVLASASADRTIKLWDLASGERRDTLSQPLREQYTVAFSPDGKRLVAGGVDNRIRVWQISETAAETTNPILESRFAHEGAILNLRFSADGRTLASAGEDRAVKLWDATGGELKERLMLERQPDWPAALAFVPEGRVLVVGRLDGSLQFYQEGKVAAASKPEVTRLEPRGIQRGHTARIKLIGKNLSAVTEVKSAEARLRIELEAAAESESGERWIGVRAESDLSRGGYELWATGSNGDSGRIKLYVDDLPQVHAPRGKRALALDTLPASIWGTHDKGGDVEEIEFTAGAGQTLVFDAAARSLGSKSELVLTLADASGKVLASNNGFDESPDPFLVHTFVHPGKYRVRVDESLLGASPDHFYRLSIGEFAYVTGCFPFVVQAGEETAIELIGHNLPAGYTVKVRAEKSKEIALPLDAERFRSRRTFELIVAESAEPVEIEPNNQPAQAIPIPVPGAVSGRIWFRATPTAEGAGNGFSSSPNVKDADLFRFETKAGRQWIIETQAAQRGSPLDTRIEVLHADGRPVERLLLQAVRDTMVNFRGVDSNNSGMRLENWEEMELNQYVFLKGEVIKSYRMPQGPDSDMLFYSSNGKRRAWFDTTAIAHALDEPGYIVIPHPVGTKLPSTGLPLLPLYFANDDDGERRLGSDSKLAFTAPADGPYLIRVTDTRGHSGDRFVYRLVVREPKPDFKVTLALANATINPGSGQSFTVTAERFDGFDDEIKVTVGGLPPGYSASTPLVIEAGHTSASGTLHLDGNAMVPEEDAWDKVRIAATASVAGRLTEVAVNNFGKVKTGDTPKLLVALDTAQGTMAASQASKVEKSAPVEITLAPGQTVPAMLRIRRNGHDELVTFTVENLPHGVIVDNIGLNGVLIPKGESEREIFLTAARWVAETERWCYAIESQAGRQTSLPVLLRVRKPEPIQAAGAR